MGDSPQAIFEWYFSLFSRRVDLVGDYAGTEPFLIELDSLLLLCFSNPKINFDDGFQLLQAVYTVEKLLQNLLSRKCNFNVVYFDQNEELCIPPGTSSKNRDKYFLARSVIIRHLQENLPLHSNVIIRHFSSFTDVEFTKFLTDMGAYFIMCHDGALEGSAKSKRNLKTTKEMPGKALQASEAAEKLESLSLESTPDIKCKAELRAMISWFIAKQYNVALINELQFLDAKVLTVVVEPPRVNRKRDFSAWYASRVPREKAAPGSYSLEDLKRHPGLSERDVVSIHMARNALESKQVSEEQASAFLLHSAALHFLPLGKRRLPKPTNVPDVEQLVLSLTKSALSLLGDTEFMNQLGGWRHNCDLSDLIDGLLLANVSCNARFCNDLLASEKVKTKFETLCAALSQVGGTNLTGKTPAAVGEAITETDTLSSPTIERGLLPFNDPVFNKHLAPIQLEIDNGTSTYATATKSRIFKEISHWHNHKKTVVHKGPPPVEPWYARRRNQWFMAEMQAYAASMTNAAGKVLEPDIIVTGNRSVPVKPKALQPTKPVKVKAEPTKPAKAKPVKPGTSAKKGGKAAALEAAAAMKAEKSKWKTNTTATFWTAKCNEILAQANPWVRYNAAKNYLRSLDRADVLGPEVELFMIDCLLRIWIDNPKFSSGIATMDIAGLIWDAYLRLSKLQTGMTQEIVTALEDISKLIGFPDMGFQTNCPSRPLAFTMIPLKRKNQERLLSEGPTKFQLEHCGPYFDRAIDSAPDPRVPFNPDGWQRKVLDGIDKNQSLFVVAPTSAGKTFISFYAMKRALEASEDEVLVYVAPTKALVNQIAAEVQGRFSKTYKHAGRSVWGIHTRDYRINNPTGCQILVTVPHILQIMLLAPSNAEKKNSWSCRIKRIIFDEVHCIGQAEDGLIWEQLLLQAPCPIIALSATVGNPKEFSDWLSSTQEANGNKLLTVEHQHRYSDLRKFIYVPPKKFSFSGLPDPPPVHVPGLDGMEAFIFVHPVASLVDRSRDAPNDLSLEARDCLRLYECMVKYQTKEYPLPKSLDPENALPRVIKKADVLKWEVDLKAVLLKWMADPSSPFGKVHEDLSRNISEHSARRNILTTKPDRVDGNERDVDAQELRSMILPALVDLHSKDSLPAIVFNYDRLMCEKLARVVITELEEQEATWKQNDPVWKKKMAEFEKWTKQQEAAKSNSKTPSKPVKKKGKRDDDEDPDEQMSKAERGRDAAGMESKWAHFDPSRPIDGFHFADIKKLTPSELQTYQKDLRRRGVHDWLVNALERGVGVHHAGMNRKYRQVVEVLFRKGYLRVVIATGTLALGINMPCKTVMFAGDSVFLTALNYRQAAGRAGRRGFDMLGNVVFLGVSPAKVFRLMSSKLPDLHGHFPITTSLVLRLATLLHETKNSPFATETINSILSQSRLYLGSPDLKMAVLHHLRFSIEYLRRQSLLDADGAPLNFAGCVSHLYYAENAAWAFHALLSAGYFHDLCKDVEVNPDRVCLTLMLVLSHIFGRRLCPRSEEEYVEEVVKHSPSVVFLPPLPEQAEKALRAHNEETLMIYRSYVKTYVEQHLQEPDDKLPLTKLRVGSDEAVEIPSLPPTKVRSPFVALSGYGDEFDSISDLCNSVRSGVFLEEAVVPYLPIYPDEADTPLNAYLYDFFKHGDTKALAEANKISASEVWFLLNDFSLVLATIITSLTNFTRLGPNSDADIMDVMGGGDALEEQRDDKANNLGQEDPKEKENGKIAGANEDDDDDEDWDKAPADHGLTEVLKAFTLVQEKFNEKFKKMWA
jgi:hypothetical protein